MCRCSLNPVRIVSLIISEVQYFYIFLQLLVPLLLVHLLRIAGSIEQSPKLMDRFRHGHLDSDYGHGDMRLKEDLADAMRESPSSAAARRDTGKFTSVPTRLGSITINIHMYVLISKLN